MSEFLKRLPIIILVLVILTGTFLSGMYAGRSSIPEHRKINTLANMEEGPPKTADFSTFWEAWTALDELYVPPQNGTSTEVTAQDKVYGSIQGLAESLNDPYTTFLPPDESKMFREDISGNFGGVGMEIGMRDDILTIISPLKGSPAMQAGLETGDKILEVNGKSTAGMSIDEGVKRIRGEKGTAVRLTIFRESRDRPFTVEITRDTIDIPSGESGLREDGVYIVRLFNFSRDSSDRFRTAMRSFLRTGSDKLVLDLRGNPGGFMEAAVDMASWFLPTGKIVVQEDFGPKREMRVHRSKGYNIFGSDLDMAVLVNQGSASASEILAGALQEHNVATLVGMQTFGKGSVQTLEKIGDGSLKVTIARWLTPKGTSISKNGLAPDVEVPIATSTPEGNDPQLERVIELLND